MNFFILRSAIKPDLMQKTLLRGTCIAGLGIGLLAATGTFMSVSVLEQWGLFIFGASVLLIGAGLIPYKRLQKLEKNPDEIRIEGNNNLYYFRQGKNLFSFPLHLISEVNWINRKTFYGIAIELKTDEGTKIPKTFIQQSRKRVASDLFFPFFTERAFNELKEFLKESL